MKTRTRKVTVLIECLQSKSDPDQRAKYVRVALSYHNQSPLTREFHIEETKQLARRQFKELKKQYKIVAIKSIFTSELTQENI